MPTKTDFSTWDIQSNTCRCSPVACPPRGAQSTLGRRRCQLPSPSSRWWRRLRLANSRTGRCPWSQGPSLSTRPSIAGLREDSASFLPASPGAHDGLCRYTKQQQEMSVWSWPVDVIAAGSLVSSVLFIADGVAREIITVGAPN